jgi:RHS repeat-associated protein
VGVTTNKFAYNGAGDLLTLADGKNQTTTWIYDQYGRVTNKVDASTTTNFVYQYDDDNRLTNRWTPARGNTKYRYDAAGNLTSVVYNVSLPISLSYDADNRLNSMVDGIGTTTYGHDQVGQLLSEGGLWPSDTVNYTYQNRLRSELSLSHPGGSAWTENYGYDSTRRLTNVVSFAGIFSYTYDPVKLLRVAELELPNSAYITNTYDSVARLLSTALINTGGTNLDSAYYVYNTAGQRTSETNTAGDYRNYTYDNESELVTAKGKEASGTSRIQEQFGYAYDAAGNLNFRTNNALIQAFNVNNLNELTTTTNGGTLTVAGTTTIPATSVTINGLSASNYTDATFALGGFTVTNGVNFYRAIGEDSSGDFSTNSVTVNLPATNNYTYDMNGNLLSDGTRNFAYDDENELICVCVSNAWSNSFAYDGKMRRRIERDYTWNGGWLETNEAHFIYDGNLVIEERNASNNPLVSYTRGNDLSGKLQGAGGIGGMLARTTYGQEIPGSPTTAFYHADGNGNITALMYPMQQLAAKYLYDPYGNMLAMSGPLMNFNKYRFSSKMWNDNAGLYYYGYRFYDPNLQRWLNRDPLGDVGFITMREAKRFPKLTNYKARKEIGETVTDLYDLLLTGNSGKNDLYDFTANNPISKTDIFGLWCWCDHSTDTDLKSCMLCAEQNNLLRQELPVLGAGGKAAAGSGAEYADPLGIVGLAELAEILHEFNSFQQLNLLRGEYAKELLDCERKFPEENGPQQAQNQYDTSMPK